MNCVLDASALLAFLKDEPGAETVDAALPHAMISTVNWAEVVQKSLSQNIDTQGMGRDLEALGLSIQPFTAEQAEIAGTLWQETRGFGLSLGDRACLALGMHKSLPVLTTDRVWKELTLTLEIKLLR